MKSITEIEDIYKFTEKIMPKRILSLMTIYNVSRQLHDLLDYILVPDDYPQPNMCTYGISGKRAMCVIPDWSEENLEHYCRQVSYYLENPGCLVGIKPGSVRRSSLRGAAVYDVSNPVIIHKNCMAWTVKGHFRNYPSGKRAFVKPHMKKRRLV